MSTSEKVTFRNGRGQELAARLELPDEPPAALALFAHCFTCSKDVAAASRVSRALRDRGFGVLRFDFTGLGNSDGDFANTNFSSNVDDLVAAADYLRETRRAPALLVGHSLGGAAVLAAAGRLPEVRAVATIAAPSDPAHVLHLLRDDLADIEEGGAAEVELAGRRFRIERQFVEDLRAQTFGAAVRGLDAALLVMHSPVDEVVSIEHARGLYELARHPKSFVALDGADHLLSRREDSQFVADVLAAWARRYVGAEAAAPPSAATSTPTAPGEVVVRSLDGPFRQRVRAGRHAWIADEPASVGGADSGPTPYDELLAALGTCTSMTLAMYARRKRWPLEGVEVRLRHDREHARDCEDCEEQDARIDVLSADLELRGPLDDEQRARLLEIAHRCPVHRTLTNEKRIDLRLVAGASA